MKPRLPKIVFIFYLLSFIFFLSPTPVSALEKFGPNITNHLNAEFLTKLRSEHDRVGTTGWVPVLSIVTPNITGGELSSFLENAKNNKFLPILRIYTAGQKLTLSQIDQFVSSLSVAQSQVADFPADIYIEFENEVNYGTADWKDNLGDPQTYTSLLREFINKIQARDLNFKLGNAAMNISVPDKPENYWKDAIDFWKEGPIDAIPLLDALFFNPYELEGGGRYSINSWEWELQQIGSPQKPIVLAEFGYQPSAGEVERMSFVEKEYSAFKTGQRQNYDKVFAITPLLHFGETGTIKVAIFASDGTVSWMDPIGGGIERGGAVIASVECDETFWGGVKAKILEGVGDLLAFLGVKVLPGLKIANLASLPKDVMDEKKLADCPEDKEANVLAQVSQNYGVASSRFTPESIPSKLSFFTQLFADFKRLVYEGEDKAGKFVKADLPMGVGEEVLAQRVETIAFRQSASEQDSQVLGFLGTKEIMKDALAIKRCANLPSSAFKDGDCVETLASLASAEISVTPGISPSPGTCELGTEYCSVVNLNLIQYFNDESLARQASQICKKESGGNPGIVNDHCLPKYPLEERSHDYSVGLFQINLLAHCEGALEDNWDTDKSCRIININRLNECQNRLENPEENIKEAVRIYTRRGDWSDWRRAATLCGFLE